MTPLQKAHFLCLDCEFTGLDIEKDRIIEVAACHFTMNEIVATFDQLVNPEVPLSPEAFAIHNISLEMVQDKPTMKEVLPSLLAFTKIPGLIAIGHGISHDIGMVARAARRESIPCDLENLKMIDTLRLARHYGDSPNNSLENLAHHFNVAHEGAHRAMNDVMANIGVFKHLVRRYHSLHEIFNILAHPIKMKFMPLGKYKGRLFSEIPLQYLEHSSRMDFDQDLLYSLRLEIKKRKKGEGFAQHTNPFAEL